MAWANFFLSNVPSSKEHVMSKLFYFISFKWVKDFRIGCKRRKEKKRMEYCEKRWEMKLRGLR